MKLLPAVLLLVFSSFVPADKVALCKSATSVAYHSKKTCRGIKSCSHDVIEVAAKQAINEYRKEPAKCVTDCSARSCLCPLRLTFPCP